jgi:CheY-like chemotaxis protein
VTPVKLQRVLIIDDDPDILAVTRITLRARGGFEVEVCQSGEKALATARRFAPDLILLDVMMPGIDGPTTLRALRGDPETAATPVVFMTAKVMKHETARYLDLGAAAVIAKPFDQRTLADELEEIARRSPSRASEDGDPELAALLDAYTAALPAKLEEIRDLWARVASGSDAEAARTLYLRVHSLAGTAASYGHPSVGDIARQLERVIGRGAVGGAEPAPGSQRAAPGLIDALDAAARSGRTAWTRD